jgi:hypothetical protein
MLRIYPQRYKWFMESLTEQYWALALVRLRYFFNSYGPGVLKKRGIPGKSAARKGSCLLNSILAIPNPS